MNNQTAEFYIATPSVRVTTPSPRVPPSSYVNKTAPRVSPEPKVSKPNPANSHVITQSQVNSAQAGTNFTHIYSHTNYTVQNHSPQTTNADIWFCISFIILILVCVIGFLFIVKKSF